MRQTMGLRRYQRKRDFGKTPEPKGTVGVSRRRGLRFVVHKHAARQLHYDFRLELDGTLKSWAVPKGPSLDPADKRLAVHVEDHPLEYGNFEGIIPEKQYGAGSVVLWDRGTWVPDGDPQTGYREGHLKFNLSGKKLRGGWALVRMKGRGEAGKEPWLLIKERDAEARPGRGADLLSAAAASVKSGRTVEEIASGRRATRAQAKLVQTQGAKPIVVSGRKPLRAHRSATKTRPASPPVIATVKITHPERVVYPDAGITKLMVAEYYARVAPRLLPYVAGRPLSIVRCPDGVQGACFFQKHVRASEIPGVREAMIEDGRGRNPYILADTARAIAGLAQMNALELHVWGARVAAIERPDTLVLDLDPDPDLPWARVAAAARLTRALLDELGLESFVKTTGGKGLHVVVPLEARHGWDQVKRFAERVAVHLARTRPEEFTATMSKARRRGKIFIDYLRNGRGATAVAPYSLRARPGASVATPLSWDELSAKAPPLRFTIEVVLERIARSKDPWVDYARRRQRLTAAMQEALGD
jgi:bifunctional non-homologous end joining protein LigD